MGTRVRQVDPASLIGSEELVTSSLLRQRLVEQGYKDANARQIISRGFAQDERIWRSEAIQLPSGARLFCRRQFFGRPRFYEQLGAILAAHRPGLARCMARLGTSGVLTRIQACKLLASPVRLEGDVAYPNLDAEIAALKELGIRVIQEGTALEYLVGARRKPNADLNERAAQAITSLRVEAILAPILIERFKRQNLVSWTGTTLPSRDTPAVVFNNQYFTACGFCHLGPLRRFEASNTGRKSVPSPVLFDLHAGQCTIDEVNSFLSRADRATCRGENRQPWLGVMAAREFDPAAWKKARNEGLLTVSFRQMFGDEALAAMARVEELLNAFQHDADPAESNQKLLSFAKCLDDLRTNPVVVDLRSVGFELLAGMALRSAGYEGVGLELSVPWNTESREVDVHGVTRGDQVRVIECKACHTRRPLTAEEVRKFFTETVPAYLRWWTQRNDGRSPSVCHAELWTSGRVGEEAKEKLRGLSLRQSIVPKLLDQKAILQELPPAIRPRCTLMLKSIAMADDTHAEPEESEVEAK